MAAQGWQPDPAALAQLADVLAHADSPNTLVQQQVVEQIDTFSRSEPSFPAYLCYMFADPASDYPETVRLRAGLTLKNNVTQRLAAFPPEILEYVKDTLWKGFEDARLSIRNTTSSILDWLFRAIGPNNWPDAIFRLMQYLQSPDILVQEAACKTLSNICRMTPRVIAHLEVNNQRPMDAIVPMLIASGLSSPSESVRISSLEALNAFIVPQAPILAQYMQPYLSGVFSLTSDSSIGVRRVVIEALNTMLSFWVDQIISHIEPVIDFMLFCLKDKEANEDLALTAAEFLLTFTEEPDLFEQLQLQQERFLPGLLEAMTFTSTSREVLDLDEDDHEKEDKASDIKPHIHKSRTTGSTSRVPSLAARMGLTADDIDNAQDSGNFEDDDVYDDEDEDDEDGTDGDWTCRIAAARALETSAETFEGALLEILLPQVTQMLANSEWYTREAAILALGTVARGCGTAMDEHLPSLIPFLLQSLKDPHPLIRSAAASTLGEYAIWVASADNEGHNVLLPSIAGLLTVALDNNKHAQGNALISFGQLCKEAGPTGSLKPHLPNIINAFAAGFAKYQHKNILKLYDTIGYLSEGLGLGGLNDPDSLGRLMPPLIERWQRFSDTDQDLLYLLECLASLVVAAGEGFQPYADPVFQRAYRLIHAGLYQYQQHQADPDNLEAPEKDWMIVSLDLTASLVQALGPQSQQALSPIVDAQADGSLPMLLVCLSYPEPAVRQSGFALIGDIARNAVSALYPVMNQLLTIAIEAINPSPRIAQTGLDSNVAWSIGELAMTIGANITPFVPSMLDRMIPIMQSMKVSAHLLENTAVTIGRLALASPESVASRLDDLLPIWGQAMMHANAGSEQDSALRGMCIAVSKNPSVIAQHGRWLLEALKVCTDPSSELRELSAPIITALQQ